MKPAWEGEQRGEGSPWKRTQVTVFEHICPDGNASEGRAGGKEGLMMLRRRGSAELLRSESLVLPQSRPCVADQPPPQARAVLECLSVKAPDQLPDASLFLLSGSQTCLLSLAANFPIAATNSPSTGFGEKVKLSELHQGLGS